MKSTVTRGGIARRKTIKETVRDENKHMIKGTTRAKTGPRKK